MRGQGAIALGIYGIPNFHEFSMAILRLYGIGYSMNNQNLLGSLPEAGVSQGISVYRKGIIHSACQCLI